MDDTLLISNCLEGDQRACKVLFDRYAPSMMAVCMRYCVRKEEAEDALQEGFIKIFQNLHSWNGSGPLGAWIRRIIVNTCLTHIRKVFPGVDYDIMDHQNISVHPDVVSKMDYDAIRALLDDMPVGYRTVFNLSVIEGYEYHEIAQMLQIKEATCRSQLFRAKNFLATKLNNDFPELKLSL